MGSHHDPPAPEIEAEAALSAYNQRLRAVESRVELESNRDSGPEAISRSIFNRLASAATTVLTRLVGLARP